LGVTIVTDSGSDMSADQASRAGIEIIPVWILVGDSRFRDGVDIDRDTVLARLAAGEAVKTEPPDQVQFDQTFARITAAGNDVVMITLSSGLSQSFARATEAAKAYPGRVHVVDSRGAAGLESLIALYASELAKTGTAAAEIAKRIESSKMKTAAYFAVPDLTALGRSGRLPKALVALGSMLNVSLILKINEQGAIGPGGQSFSFDKTCEIMVDAVVRTIEHSQNTRIAFSHAKAAALVAKLSKMLEEKLGHPPIVEIVSESPATIIANIGEGGVGIFALVP
jgi:DegV family protein with EDD domain